MKPQSVAIVNLYTRALFEPRVEAPFGGTEVQLAALARVLAARKRWDLKMVVGNFGQPKRETLEGMEFYRSVAPGQTKLMQRALNSARYWKAFKRANADVYLTSADAGTLLWRLTLFCKRHRRALVNRISSDSFCDRDFLSNDPARAKLYESALHRCDVIVAQNTRQQDALRQLFGVHSLVLKSLGPEVVGECRLQDREHILWVGRANRMKRPELFMDLAEAIPEEKFVLCISGDEEALLETVRRSAKGVKNLTLLESLTPEQLLPYYRKAKLLVNTSDYEGFPSSFVEALCSGAPVAALNVDPDGLLSRGGLGCVAAGDMKDLVQGIRALLQPQTWAHTHHKVLRYARENHDPEKVADKYEQVLVCALERRHRG